MSYKKVLIAVDSSEFSINAAKKGIALAAQLDAESALLYVIDTSKALGNVDAGILPDDALLILKKEAEQTLEQLASMFPKQKITKLMPEGKPKEDILKTAEAWEADLLVLGTHGRTGLVHLLMGSVAEYIVKNSKIPVMIVPVK